MSHVQPVPAEDLMHYVVHHVPQPERLGHTKLVKLLYFIDLYCRQYLGRPASEFNWCLYKYGPFPEGRQFYDRLESLESRGDILNVLLPCGESGGQRHQVESQREGSGYPFPAEIKAIVDSVLADLGGLTPEQLRNYSYQTAPVRALCPTPGDNPGVEQILNMDAVNNIEKHRLGGLDLREVLEGRRQYLEGRTTPWQEFQPEFHALSHG